MLGKNWRERRERNNARMNYALFFTFPFLPSNTGVGFQSTFPSSEKGKHGTGQRATSKGVPCQPLALKSSAKKYERRWMVPLQPTAVYQPAVSLLYCAHTAITTLSIISIFLVQFKLASVYICVFKAYSCCSAVLIIWLVWLLRQKHVPLNWREASILIKFSTTHKTRCINHWPNHIAQNGTKGSFPKKSWQTNIKKFHYRH